MGRGAPALENSTLFFKKGKFAMEKKMKLGLHTYTLQNIFMCVNVLAPATLKVFGYRNKTGQFEPV